MIKAPPERVGLLRIHNPVSGGEAKAKQKILCRHFLLSKHKEPVDQRAATGPILLSRRGNVVINTSNYIIFL